MAAGVIDRAARHGVAEHVFQAQRLGGELDVVVNLLSFGTVFEFHWKYRAVRVKFHQIRLADQAQPIRPERQRAFHFHPGLHLVTGRIDQVMHSLAARGVDVVRERLFQMDQAALARTVGPVLERGERDGIDVDHQEVPEENWRAKLQYKFPQEFTMATTFEQAKALAMQLTPEQRADLADLLWVSVTPREEVQAAWDTEIARRIAEIDAGTVELIPGEEVFARIERKLRKAGA